VLHDGTLPDAEAPTSVSVQGLKEFEGNREVAIQLINGTRDRVLSSDPSDGSCLPVGTRPSPAFGEKAGYPWKTS
jgi:hypothetical protein